MTRTELIKRLKTLEAGVAVLKAGQFKRSAAAGAPGFVYQLHGPFRYGFSLLGRAANGSWHSLDPAAPADARRVLRVLLRKIAGSCG